jgi:5'-3' exonuclease
VTILIDGNNLLFRELNNLDKPGKDNTHPVRSLYNDLSTNDDLTVIVWDGYGGNDRRKAIFPEYKGNRGEKGEDVYAIFKLFQELMQHTNVMQIKVPTYEADDVIYTLAKFFTENGDKVVINTNDADYLQMADLPGVSLPHIRRWLWDADLICTYKALVGDPADNIPGMPGFGEGAWGHVRTYHETLREALRDNNWELWSTIPFPKRNQKACGDKGNFDQCVLFFKVVSMIDVPLDDIAKHSNAGKVDVNLAHSLMDRYMI